MSLSRTAAMPNDIIVIKISETFLHLKGNLSTSPLMIRQRSNGIHD
jgi:hypothetical protein